jgi:hypothetical protein
LEKAWAQTVAMPFKPIQSPVAAHLGEAYLRTERMGDAMAFATQALELSRQHKERGHEAWGLRTLGEVALAQEPPDADQAEGAFRQASVLAGELGMRPGARRGAPDSGVGCVQRHGDGDLGGPCT